MANLLYSANPEAPRRRPETEEPGLRAGAGEGDLAALRHDGVRGGLHSSGDCEPQVRAAGHDKHQQAGLGLAHPCPAQDQGPGLVLAPALAPLSDPARFTPPAVLTALQLRKREGWSGQSRQSAVTQQRCMQSP